MKSIKYLLFFATLATSTPVEKDEKAFSLFSLVTFPNGECKTNLLTDPLTSGLCLTASECTDVGGTPKGKCASSFGVCCFLRVSATDSVISNNITYIENDEYPTPYGGIANAQARTWRYTLEGNKDICQFRLDFENVVLHQPNAITGDAGVGKCGGNGDTLTIENPTASFAGFQNLCGVLSGQHIYIHYSFDKNDGTVENVHVTLSIGSNTFERHWKIKTSRFGCGSPDNAEEGCLQWFTDLGGRIQSFNYGTTTKLMITNLLYNICIRKGDGMCGMEVSQTRTGNQDSFRLSDAPVAGQARVGSNCNSEFISIESTKYCGDLLASADDQTTAGTIPSDVLPLRINVGTTVGDANNMRATNTGFDLTYSQTPCNN